MNKCEKKKKSENGFGVGLYRPLQLNLEIYFLLNRVPSCHKNWGGTELEFV